MKAATVRPTRTSPRKTVVGQGSVSTGGREGKVLEEEEETRHISAERNNVRDGTMRNLEDEEEEDEAGELIEEDDGDLPELSTLLLRGSSRDGGGHRKDAASSDKTAIGRKGRSGSAAILPDESRDAQTSNPRSSGGKGSENGASQVGPGVLQATAREPIVSTSFLLGATPRLQPTKTKCMQPAPAAHLGSTTTTSRSSRQMQQRKSPGNGQMPRSPVKKSVASPAKKTAPEFSDSGFPLSESTSAKAKGTDYAGSLKLAHVDSLLQPLSGLTLQSDDTNSNNGRRDDSQSKPCTSKPSRLVHQQGLKSSDRRGLAKKRRELFVLSEATCADDTGGSDEDSDEEFTDLSGFIVDDNADISFHNSDVLSEAEPKSKKTTQKSPGKRKLVRGAKKGTDGPTRDLSDELRSLSLESAGCVRGERPKTQTDSLVDEIARMHLGGEYREPHHSRSKGSKVEVVDLTFSPEKFQAAPPFDQVGKKPASRYAWSAEHEQEFDFEGENHCPPSGSINAPAGKEAILRFSPPTRKSPFKMQRKESAFPLREVNRNALENAELNHDTFTTPPQTPPASPSKLRSLSKLNSPSKRLLLSPSKRANQIPQSPHRQSIDAFWSSEVINEWNDEYSPLKPPLTVSPKKKWKIWDHESDSGSESPCESPARRMGSPTKTVESPSKRAGPDNKKPAAAAANRKFSDEKADLSKDLLKELDEKVSDGILAQLSQNTGGVKVIWSKNLRSTAGRANWRRTVTKTPIDSQVKSDRVGTVVGAGDVKVQHYASIELAEKVIDSEERLVNTLAHEYCHLANFMVSGVRDQPHGASFKRWAQKVTSTFQDHPRDIYRQVQVTTKHSYEINHKYVWVCVGTPRNAARDFLNLPDDDGCGAEYGRHSKSVDPEKHRCGKCKGVLEQVRPKPRKVNNSGKTGRSPVRKENRQDALGRLEEAMDSVTIGED